MMIIAEVLFPYLSVKLPVKHIPFWRILNSRRASKILFGTLRKLSTIIADSNQIITLWIGVDWMND